jgi:hypothetical protein
MANKVKTPEEILQQLIKDVEDPAKANGPAAQLAVSDAKAYFAEQVKKPQTDSKPAGAPKA